MVTLPVTAVDVWLALLGLPAQTSVGTLRAQARVSHKTLSKALRILQANGVLRLARVGNTLTVSELHPFPIEMPDAVLRAPRRARAYWLQARAGEQLDYRKRVTLIRFGLLEVAGVA